MKYLIASIFSVTVMIENTNTQTKQIQQAQQIESYTNYQVSNQKNIDKKVDEEDVEQPVLMIGGTSHMSR